MFIDFSLLSIYLQHIDHDDTSICIKIHKSKLPIIWKLHWWGKMYYSAQEILSSD